MIAHTLFVCTLIASLLPENTAQCRASFGPIVVADTVTIIDAYAYEHCGYLSGITIPVSVTYVGEGAFMGCSELVTVILSNSITSIASNTFAKCSSLTDVTIPDSVTRIGTAAFDGCMALTMITIPDSVTYIGNGGFLGCRALRSVMIADSVTYVGDNVFPSCVGFGLSTVFTADFSEDDYAEVYVMGDIPRGNVQCVPCTGQTSIQIPNEIKIIGANAFSHCSALVNVSIPRSVMAIGENAFGNCVALEHIFMPDTVIAIKANAFVSCSAVTTVLIPDSVKIIAEGCFSSCSALASVALGTSLTWVGAGAFSECNTLTTIDIGDSISYIGESAFGSCTALTSAKISASFISDYMFDGCSALTEVTISDSVQYIGTSAFYSCNALMTVSIGNSVTTIADGAFQFCSSLSTIFIPDSVTTIGETAFYGCILCGIAVDDQVDDDANQLHAVITSVPTIPSYTFFHCARLSRVTISDSVTTIRPRAISFSISLNNVSIPNSVTVIEYSAFQGCTGLSTIRIPPRVNVSNFAFFGCLCGVNSYMNGTALQDCEQGYIDSTDTWTKYNTCNESSEYERVPGSYTTNRQCESLTICNTTTQIEATSPTPTSNRLCSLQLRNSTTSTLSTANKVAISIGVVILGMCIVVTIAYLQQKRKRTESDLHLHELLLEDERAEKQSLYAENIAMKRGWEISEADLNMKQQVAAGAYGSVWQATWGHVDVAVKMLKNLVDDDFGSLASEDFNREVSFMQQIRHPNLVLFYGAGVTSDNVPFLVVEFMRDGSMRQVLLSKRVLSVSTRLGMAVDIAHGMRHLHSIGSIHRDLKSDNCLVGDNMRIKVADFGTSRLMKGGVLDSNTGTATATSVICGGGATASGIKTHGVGTPLWMAPEMMQQNSAYGQEIDVYSFGIVMWELLTRSTPWETDILDTGAHFSVALWGAVQEGRRPSIPSETDFPDMYLELMKHCWCGEPGRRPLFISIAREMEVIHSRGH